MTQEPFVSVIIPIYNGRKWIEKSVSSVLEQTYQNFEILIIDDGSTEDIRDLEIMNDGKIRYFRNENHGVAYSRNYGIKMAKGKYVAFLDCDDFWTKNKLEVQISAMEQAAAKWSQHSYYYYSDKKNKVIGKNNTYIYRKGLDKYQFCSLKVQTSCFIVEKQAILMSNSWFDESKQFGEDDFFFQCMIKHFPLQCINHYLSYFRIRENNAGFNAKKQIFNRATIWHEYMNDKYFVKNTTFYVRAMYRYCGVMKTNIERYKVKNTLLIKIIYFLPWCIFKLEAKRIQVLNIIRS